MAWLSLGLTPSSETLATWRSQDADRMKIVTGLRFGDARMEFLDEEASPDGRYAGGRLSCIVVSNSGLLMEYLE